MGWVAWSLARADNVRSLILPGARDEKITHLGAALQNFARLKHLDLSNNELASLQGIEHLTTLEKLNLYLNKVPDFKVP